MTISRGVSGMLLLLGALAIFVGNHGVEAHFKPFSAHFDNPPACTLGPVKIGTHSDRNSTEIEIMSAGGKPCITRKTFLSSDNTCSGEPYATDTLIADEDCWRLPAPPGVADAPASEYYKIKCNTDGTIHGRMLCGKGCVDCVDTNFRSGYSDSFIDLLTGQGKYAGALPGLPVDGSCVNVKEEGLWNDGRDVEVQVDYTFEGVCVANPHEGAFDDPDHFIMQFITGENAPVTLLGGGLGLVGICVLAYYLIKYLDENNAEDDIGEPALAELRAKNCCTKCCTRNGRACQGILAVFMLAGGAALFLGLFVLDSMTAVLVGFVVLIVVVVFQVVWNICRDHKTYKKKKDDKGAYKKEVDKYGDKIEALDNKDDGDLHDDSGAETSTRYMDFEQPISRLFVLLASQVVMVGLLCTEMVNYWGDEGAEYDQDMDQIEARNIVFFLVAILLQPNQYNELFGDNGSKWTAFYEIVLIGRQKQWKRDREGKLERDETGEKIPQEVWLQKWTEEFRTTTNEAGEHESKVHAHWVNIDLDQNSYCERLFRWVMMAIGGFFVPTIMLIFTPVLLTFTGTALDFVMNAFALAFIGAMDNGAPTRLRITSHGEAVKQAKEQKEKMREARANSMTVEKTTGVSPYGAPAENVKKTEENQDFGGFGENDKALSGTDF